jgi:hypothetical protein
MKPRYVPRFDSRRSQGDTIEVDVASNELGFTKAKVAAAVS